MFKETSKFLVVGSIPAGRANKIKRICGRFCKSFFIYANCKVMSATTIYLAVLATATIAINEGKGSRRMPATRVMGSPTNGAQLNSSDQRPYLLYHASALASFCLSMGNQRRS